MADMKKLLEGLTEDQKKAVFAPPQGWLRIAAGAGSGKTEVLTRRIMGMLASGVNPEELVAITYTQKAAAEMKSRLVERRKLPPYLLRDMRVSTFHAFIGDFIKQDPFGAGIDRSDAVISENDRQLILAELKEKFAELHGTEIISGPESLGAGAAARLIKEFPDALGKIRRFLLKPAEFYNLTRSRFKKRGAEVTQLEKNTLEWLFRFSTYFIEELQNRSLLDFDEILIKGRSLVKDMVENGDKPAQKVFLIDEFQDNNPDQLEIVKLFAGQNEGHITVVGDEKQSIYRFQGADVSTFRNFASNDDIILVDNFRSYSEIIELADSYLQIGGDTGKLTVPQVAFRGNSPRKPPVVCLTTPDAMTDEEVCNQMTDFIKEIVDSGMSIFDRKTNEERCIKYGDIAIILGSVKSLPSDFEDALAMRQIPYVMSGGFSFYARSEIEEIMSFLKLLVQPDDDYSVTKILTGPLYGLKDSEIAGLALAGRNEKTSLLPHILAQKDSLLPQAAIEFRKLFLYLKNRSSRPGLLELCHTILEQAGFYEFAAVQKSELKRRRMENNLNKFLAIVRNFEQNGIFTSLRDFLNHIEKVLLSGIDEDEAGLGLEEGDAIKILTIHKSKGLEFPIVFCPFLKARHYKADAKIYFDPQNGLMVADPEQKNRKGFTETLLKHVEEDRLAAESEDRRKLYVAFTRAEDLLVVSGEESRSVLSEENESKSVAEPLAEIKSIIESKPDLGLCKTLSDWPKVLEKWLEHGTRQEPEAKSDSILQTDLNEIKSQLGNMTDFLAQTPTGKAEEKPVEDIFSLQDLGLYNNCPRKYFFTSRHINSFSEKQVSYSGLAGTIFHETARIFHEKSGHELHSIVEKVRLADVIISDLCELHEEDGKLVKAKVHRLFRTYLESELSSRKPWQLEAEVNIKFSTPTAPFFLRGFADRVEKEGAEVRIIDFKTRSYLPEVHEKYSDQLALYMIAATRGVLGETGKLNFASAYIAYLDEAKLRLVELNPDLIAFEKYAIETVEKIRNDKTWLPNPETDCESCGFAVLCHQSSQTKSSQSDSS
jgi:ATP-dependent exoDNAse (exonuclease V) beta subunit